MKHLVAWRCRQKHSVLIEVRQKAVQYCQMELSAKICIGKVSSTIQMPPYRSYPIWSSEELDGTKCGAFNWGAKN